MKMILLLTIMNMFVLLTIIPFPAGADNKTNTMLGKWVINPTKQSVFKRKTKTIIMPGEIHA